jgi:hypothetical protein
MSNIRKMKGLSNVEKHTGGVSRADIGPFDGRQRVVGGRDAAAAIGGAGYGAR